MATIAKPPTGALIVLALAGFWWLTQRNARAATGSALPAGSVANMTPAVRAYGVGPSGTVAQVTPLGVFQSILQSVSGLIGAGQNRGGAPLSASGLPTVLTSANPYGFDAVQPGDLASAYSFGGPSMGVYGSTSGPAPGAPWGTGSTGVALGSDAAYYGTITNPATFTGDPYNDGGGNYDAIVANPAPGVDWVQPWAGPQ